MSLHKKCPIYALIYVYEGWNLINYKLFDLCNTCVYPTHVLHLLECRRNACVADTNVLHMFYTCSTHVLHMFYTCSIHVLHMFYTCSTHVLHMFYTYLTPPHMYYRCGTLGHVGLPNRHTNQTACIIGHNKYIDGRMRRWIGPPYIEWGGGGHIK